MSGPCAAGPPRIGRVALLVRTPGALDPDHRAGILGAIDQCTVANTLRQPPQVTVEIESQIPDDVASPERV